MSKRGIHATRSQASEGHQLTYQSFMGISLGGAKSDRTCAAIVEYYPRQKKIFLARLYENLQSPKPDVSLDRELIKLIRSERTCHLVAINAPLDLPKCLRCKKKCPGIEGCREPEILWLWQSYRRRVGKTKNTKLFAPYIERCAELFLAYDLEESFHYSHALGANTAPLTARMYFLKRQMKEISFIETYPKLTLWRIGKSLKLADEKLLGYRHALKGEKLRSFILDALVATGFVFLYDQDRRILVNQVWCFEAFLSALTALFKHLNLCEPRPRNFPKEAGWIEYPRKGIFSS